MKKFKIKNPALRWFAGLGILLVGVPVALGAIMGLCYRIGKLTLSFWMKAGVIVPPYESADVGWAGIFTLGAIAIGFMILVGFYYASRWAGNTLFNNRPEGETKPVEEIKNEA